MVALPRQRFAPIGATLRALIRGSRPSGSGSRKMFERELIRRYAVPDAIAVNSGRAALSLLLRASGLPVGGGVALAALNFVPLVDAIAAGGWRPVPVDVDPATWTLSPQALEVALWDDPGIRVVLATHLFGNPCDIVGIRAICDRHGVVLLEDCAHGVLQRVEGGLLGTFGAGALLSLEASKPLSALSGGVSLCVALDLAAQARVLASALPVGDESVTTAIRFARFSVLSAATMPGIYSMVTRPVQRVVNALAPFRNAGSGDSVGEARKTRMPLRTLSDAQACVALVSLDRIDDDNRRRSDIVSTYRAALPRNVAGMASLEGDPALLYFPVSVEAPELVASRLLARGVDTRRGYMGDCSGGRCPVATRLSSRMLCLPVWPGLPVAQVRWIACQVGACLGPA